MTVRSRLIKGTAILSIGQIAAQAASFARNIVIARMLSKDDVGIAALFALTMTGVELMSDMAVDRLLVQDRDGDDPKMQATAQLIQLVRGLIGGLLIFTLAGPLAVLFDAPDTAWAFRWIALVPVMRGLMHLDYRRVQRDLQYSPSVIVDSVPQILTALAAWPLVQLTQSYSAVIWLILGQATVTLILSHCVAKRPFSVAWIKMFGVRALRFGWPLMLNGILLFLVMLGDKFVVGANYSKEQLSDYYLAFTLATLPTLVLVKVFSSLLLPWLSKSQEQHTVLQSRSTLSMQAVCVVSLCVTVTFLIAGESLVVLVYGQKYKDAGEYLVIFGAMTGIRLMRAMPTLIAVAKADTVIPLYTNIIRSLALFAVVYLAVRKMDVRTIAIAGLCGETLAFLCCCIITSYRHSLRYRTFLLPAAGMAALSLVGIFGSVPIHALASTLPSTLSNLATVLAAATLGCIASSALLLALPSLREQARFSVHQLRARSTISTPVS